MNINKNNFTEIEARLKEEATLRLNYSENQILQTNMIRIVWLRVRKITDEILGVNGLNLKMPFDVFYTFSFSLAQQQQN